MWIFYLIKLTTSKWFESVKRIVIQVDTQKVHHLSLLLQFTQFVWCHIQFQYQFPKAISNIYNQVASLFEGRVENAVSYMREFVILHYSSVKPFRINHFNVNFPESSRTEINIQLSLPGNTIPTINFNKIKTM